MKKIFSVLAIAAALAGCSTSPSEPLYKDASAPIEKRVEDLLGRMTLEEKVAQMNMFVGIEHVKQNQPADLSDDAKGFYPNFPPDSIAAWTQRGWIGSFLHVLTLEEANWLQSLALQSRLQIPLMFGIDAIHGNCNAPGNTAYPTNIGLASTFNTSLAYKIAQQTAREMRAMNMHWAFNPNVEVARDPRWSRVGETYGEDPYLVSRMGVATVKGYEGDLGSENVLSCTKHLVAGSQSVNGANKAPSDISERTLREVFFPPFEACAKAGSRTYMVAHNEINGVPCHTNKWLMQDVLRDEWGWDGIMVSDWMDIERVFLVHSTADSYKEAFRQAIDAGIDVHMHGIRWQELVCELVREGSISEKRIDRSVRRVLECKFRLGLFEQPYADPEKTMETRLCPEHRATALEAARESIVLMKNNGLLPLDPNVARRVLVTGINADEQGILGDWAAPMAEDDVVTILEGLRAAAPKTEFIHIDQGWNPFEMTEAKVEEAARAAKGADLSIVVVSEATMRFRPQRTNGENADRSDNLPFGLQCKLLEKVAQAGKPVILVYTSGRPLSIPWTKQSDSVPAIINAWEPGMYGGQAVAEVIYGIINPSGKLPVTIAESTAQVLNVYNHKPSHFFNKYTGSAWEPYYPFGYGLSYTTFRYDKLTLSSETISAKDNLKVSVDITNTGDMEGVEIAQLYIRDCYSQVSRPVKELKGFRRCALTPGQTATVEFEITPQDLSFLDLEMKPTVEPGDFIVMVGSSSRDEDLLQAGFKVQ